MDDEQEQQQTIEQRQAEVSFWSSLPKFYKHNELQNNFRRTVEGLFVSEPYLDRLVSSYQSWLRDKTGSSIEKSIEKCRRRLFGNEQLKLYYVLDGKKCLAGYVVPVDQGVLKNIPVPSYQANLMDTRDYIHPRDPILTSTPNVKPILHPHEGLIMEISAKSQTIKVTELSLHDFSATARNIKPLIDQYPALDGPLRGHLSILATLLQQAAPVPPKQRLLIPEKLKERPGTQLWKTEALVFALTAEDRLERCYGLNRKNALELIQEEVRAFRLQQQPKKGKRGKQRLTRLATLFIGKQRYALQLNAFMQFVDYAKKSPTLRASLGKRFSPTDLFKTCGSIFEKTRKLEAHESRRLQNKDEKRELEFRKAGSWYFVLANDTIIDCFQKLRLNKNKAKGGKANKTRNTSKKTTGED